MNFVKFFADCERGGRTAKIAVLGDSVTEGCFETYDDFNAIIDYDAVYHEILKQKILSVFPKLNLEIINAGAGGTNAENGFDRLENDVISHNPDLVIVCYGLNECGEAIKSFIPSLRKIFARLKEKNISVIYMSPNMMSTRVDERIENESLKNYAKIAAVRQGDGDEMDRNMTDAAKLCKEMNVPLCDCYGRWKTLAANGVDTTSLLSNYVNHPTRPMHELFACSLFECILFE